MVKGGWGGKVTSLSSQDIQGYSGEERDVEFRGKNTSGYLRDKVTAWTKHASAYHQNPPPSSPFSVSRVGHPYEIEATVSSSELKYIPRLDITRLWNRDKPVVYQEREILHLEPARAISSCGPSLSLFLSTWRYLLRVLRDNGKRGNNTKPCTG